MTAKVLYRIAAVAFVLFALGHTAGFLTFRPASAEALAVHNAMKSVTFDFNGVVRTYGEFYMGFGLQISAYLVLGAFLAWHLSNQASNQPRSIAPLAWAFVTAQLAIFILSARYFFIVPATLCAVIFICLLVAAWRLRKAAA
jgi:hypothetical protein